MSSGGTKAINSGGLVKGRNDQKATGEKPVRAHGKLIGRRKSRRYCGPSTSSRMSLHAIRTPRAPMVNRKRYKSNSMVKPIGSPEYVRTSEPPSVGFLCIASRPVRYHSNMPKSVANGFPTDIAVNGIVDPP